MSQSDRQIIDELKPLIPFFENTLTDENFTREERIGYLACVANLAYRIEDLPPISSHWTISEIIRGLHTLL